MRTLSLTSFLMLALCLHGCGGGDKPTDAPADDGANVEAPGESMEDASLGAPGEMPSTDSSSADASNSSAGTANAGDSTLNYIPDDAVLAMVVRPSKALNNPLVKEMITLIGEANPRENIAEKMAEFESEVGVKPEQVDHVLFVVDKQLLEMAPLLMMGGFGGPPTPVEFEEFEDEAVDVPELDRAEEAPAEKALEEMAFQPGGFGGPGEMGPPPTPIVVVQLANGAKSQQVLDSVPQGESIEIAGGTGVTTPDGGVLFKVSDSRLVYSSKDKLESVLKNSSNGGVKAMLAKSAASDFAVAVDMEPVKGLLQQAAQGNPAMGLVMPIVSQFKTITIAADLEADNLLQVNVDTPNAEAAEGVQASLTGFLGMGKQQYEQAKGEIPPEMQALANQLVNGAALSTSDSVVSLTVPRPDDFEKLPELLKPAMAQAAKAAQRTQKRNDFKQIGLAFHNYHDVYGHFPAVDSNGEKDEAGVRGKGLSWRVHLLPFLDQAPLYQEFKLDEAWDSEHNKALIAEMPEVFGDNPEGKTSVHVIVGEKLAFNEDKPGARIRDYLDGTSNTILAVKAGEDTAEIWTKPGGLKFNPEDPFAALGNIGETFIALFCDGSVQNLSKDLDKTTLSNLIQQNDGNPVDF